MYDPLRVVVPLGLTNTEGAFWRRQRHFITPVFHGANMDAMLPLIASHVSQHIEKWKNLRGEPIDVHFHLSQLTLQVIFDASMGVKELPSTEALGYSIYHEFGYMMKHTAECLVSPLRFVLGDAYMWLPGCGHSRYFKSIHKLQKIVTGAIQTRQKEIDVSGSGSTQHENLLDLMLHELQHNQNEDERMSMEEVRDQIGTFLAAGHETTSSLTSFCLYHLVMPGNKHIVKKLQAEADAVYTVLQKSKKPFGLEEVSKLVYTDAVLKETLRHDGPGPVIARESLVNETLPNGMRITKGMHIWISPWMLHHDATKWDEPDRFNPERWMNDKPCEPWQFLPFSNGPRNCIGQRFAMHEARIIISMIMRHFDLESIGHEVTRETAITQRPKNGIIMKLQPRHAM